MNPVAVLLLPPVLLKERGITVGGVDGAGGVDKSANAPLAVLSTAGGVLKAPPRQSPYFVCGVEKERPRADSGVEAAVCVAKERIPTNSLCSPMPVVRLKRAFWPSAVLNPG